MSETLSREDIREFFKYLVSMEQLLVAMAASLREVVGAVQELHSFVNNTIEEAKKGDQEA